MAVQYKYKNVLCSSGDMDTSELCGHSCLTRFITKVLSNVSIKFSKNKYLYNLTLN